jgi:hypothetical protein
VVHIDSSTIKANASKDNVIPKLKLLSESLYNELDKNTEDESGNPQKISKTDPDAGFGKKKGSPSVLGYKEVLLILQIITALRKPDTVGLKKSR